MARKNQNNNTVILYGVGDVRPYRRNPEYPYKDPLFTLSAPITKNGDIVFCNLEGILSTRPNPKYYSLIHPDNIKDVTEAGFNVANNANNHHMDAGVEAFIDTLNCLKNNNIHPVGVGMNIAEARTAVIVGCKGVKVGFLGYSSLISKGEISYDAEDDRPGCAPMYINTYYEATDWHPGSPFPRIVTIAEEEDLAAMVDDVKRAKARADVVVISFHWGVHRMPGIIAQYEYTVGKAAIDAGADLILGHGAHILKGISVYKGKVIFHNLGNFAADAPVQKRSLGDVRHDALFYVEPDPEYPTFKGSVDGRKMIIVKATITDKQIQKVSFLPVMVNRLGQPEPLSHNDKRSEEVFDYVKWCCQDQKIDTKFMREGDEITIITD
ncbi:CapA family protein [Chloroflexota bacterium]